MTEDKRLTEQESLQLIAQIIQKTQASYYDTGIGALLWGTVVSVASLVNCLEITCHFYIGFDIWIIVLAAIIPQVVINIRERKNKLVKKHEDEAVDTVWTVFGISIFGLVAYQIFVPAATISLIHAEGWELVKHYLHSGKSDEIINPFPPSIYSIFILLYAFPTMVTGIVKKFRPMLTGALIAYVLFITSLFTATQYDMLFGGITAVVCWFIPGVILRKNYLVRKSAHV